MVVILIILALVCILSSIINRILYHKAYYSSLEEWFSYISIISGTILAIALIALPISNSSSKMEVQRYYALKNTIQQSRDKGETTDLERASILSTIVEYNKDLAETKYWNGTIWDIYISDELANLPYLE